MKKIFLLIIAFLFFVFPIFAQIEDIQKDEVNLNEIASPAERDRNDVSGEQIKSFNSEITVTKEGKINVREIIIYDFSGLQKHGIYREIPFIKTNEDGKKFELKFDNFSVQDENGRPYNFTTSYVSEKNIRLKIGDADRLIIGIHTYVISYEVSGALTYYSDHDELYWNITGNGWTIPIINATASINLPENLDNSNVKLACYTGSIGDNLTLCKTSYESGKATIVADESLFANQGLTVVVGIPKNIVAVLEPKEIVDFWETFLGKIVSFLFIVIGLIWYIFLPIYIVYRWIKYGRDPKSTVEVTTAWFDPPKTQDGKRLLTPGEVGTLGDETVDMKDISASIVDLARRGYLIIEEKKKGEFYLLKGKKTSKEKELLLFEKKLLDGIFSSGDDIVKIKDKDLSETVADVKNKLYEQVVEDKLFDKNPQSTRTKFYALAGVALFTGNFFLAIISFIFGRAMPRKTVYGVEAKNVSFSLKNFLTSQKRQLEFQADKQLMFERLLPFAVAFGVERIWAKRFQTLNIAQPTWYHGYSSTNFNSYLFVNSLNSSFKTFNRAATPTRSSSGFSSGFSGGGFSGGGGGGGGGGSW